MCVPNTPLDWDTIDFFMFSYLFRHSPMLHTNNKHKSTKKNNKRNRNNNNEIQRDFLIMSRILQNKQWLREKKEWPDVWKRNSLQHCATSIIIIFFSLGKPSVRTLCFLRTAIFEILPVYSRNSTSTLCLLSAEQRETMKIINFLKWELNPQPSRLHSCSRCATTFALIFRILCN